MAVHAMDDVLPVLEEPELNYIDFCGVTILSKVFKVSHVPKCLVNQSIRDENHPSFLCLGLSDQLIFLCSSCPANKPTYVLTTLCYFLFMKVAAKATVLFGLLLFNY